MSKELAELLYPDVKTSVEDLLKKYPERGCAALRIAPSPTGYLHVGSLGMCLVDVGLAKTFDGKFLLRIEDTDQKREVKDATISYVRTLAKFGIKFDEGFDGEKDYGRYGPYVQSRRVDIYHVFAKRLVELGGAYPCFCSEEDLESLRKKQEGKKEKTGYYGEHAVCKKLTLDEVRENIYAGKPWALRADFSSFKEGERVCWRDLVKGEMSLPVETNHPVVIKSNGIPPYNFAHVVDDTLMRISHVVRGEEWLVSTAQHIQIFRLLGLKAPHYLHPPVICVEEGGNKRKLSKRKDREAVAENFLNDGYPPVAVIEYLLTLYNTDFEMWRIANPNVPYQDFNFKFEKIGSNSPLFDWNKLNDISKNVIAKMTCLQINAEVLEYFSKADNAEAQVVLEHINKVYAVLAIDRETEKPRKDIVKYSDIYELYKYLFDGSFITAQDSAAKNVLSAYAGVYDERDAKEQWFDKIKKLCHTLGYCDNVKEYKQNPDAYKGHIGDVTQIIRRAVTGRENSPDLYAISRILGGAEMKKRLLR